MLKKILTWTIVFSTLFLSIHFTPYHATPEYTHSIYQEGGDYKVKNENDSEETSHSTLQAAVDFASNGENRIIRFGKEGESPSSVKMSKGIPLFANYNAIFMGELRLEDFTEGVDGSLIVKSGVAAIFNDLTITNTTTLKQKDDGEYTTSYVQGSVVVQKNASLHIQGASEIIHTDPTNAASAINNYGNITMKSGIINVYGNGITNITDSGTKEKPAGIIITGGLIQSRNYYAIYIDNSTIHTQVSVKNAIVRQLDFSNGNPAIFVTSRAIPSITIYNSAGIYSERVGNLGGVIVMDVPNRDNNAVKSGAGNYGLIRFIQESPTDELVIHRTYHARTALKGLPYESDTSSYITGDFSIGNGIKNATITLDRIINCENFINTTEKFKNWSNGENAVQVETTNPTTISAILSKLPQDSTNLYANFYCPKSTEVTFIASSNSESIPLTKTISDGSRKLSATVKNSVNTFDLSFLKEDNSAEIKDSNGTVLTSSSLKALALNVGLNTFTYSVTSKDERSKVITTYTIEITREAEEVIQLVAPSIVPSSETVKKDTPITITHPEDGVMLYYTTDGSDPATSLTRKLYDKPFVLSEDATVKAYASKEGKTPSEVTSKTYTAENAKLSNSTEVKFTASSNSVNIPLTKTTSEGVVTLSASVSNSVDNFDLSYLKDVNNAVIKDDKGTVLLSSPANKLSLNVGKNKYTYTVTSEDGTKTTTYTIEITREAAKATQLATPSIVPSSETIKKDTTITITHPEDGVMLYYTTDGSDPATSLTRKLYDKPFVLSEDATVKAYASKEGKTPSEVTSSTYKLTKEDSLKNEEQLPATGDQNIHVYLLLVGLLLLLITKEIKARA